MRNLAVCKDFVSLLCPACNLLNTTARVFVKRNVVICDKVRILVLDIEHIVFGVVLTRLCAVIAQTLDVIKAHHIVMLLFGVICCKSLCVDFKSTALDFGIKVVALFVVNFEKPCHMVDTCNSVVEIALADLLKHTDVFK